jgi:hypothetical protein
VKRAGSITAQAACGQTIGLDGHTIVHACRVDSQRIRSSLAEHQVAGLRTAQLVDGKLLRSDLDRSVTLRGTDR